MSHSQTGWVPLHVHSQYSILDATASVEGIVSLAAERGMPACALTDHGNLFGAVAFHRACIKYGIQPIIGCELYLAPHSRFIKKKIPGERNAHHLLLLAKNQRGYQNLCILSSLAYKEGFYYRPRIDRKLLENHCEGLICLSGCLSGTLAHTFLERPERFEAELEWYCSLFGEDFYLEVQRHAMSEEELEREGMQRESWLLQNYRHYLEKESQINAHWIEISQKRGIPLVATQDSHYLHQREWKAHEIFINIQSGEPCEIWERDAEGKPKYRIPNPKRRVYPAHTFHFSSAQEMAERFADLPSALSETLSVAGKCSFLFNFEEKHYPVFPLPQQSFPSISSPKEQQQCAASYLEELCRKAIARRYTDEKVQALSKKYPEQDPHQLIEERLCEELKVIASKGLADYLLIVYDFIAWAREHSIPIGPGRGSGVGSIILYLIEVTNIEPLFFGLLFERFLNIERFSYPDIDVDICIEGRERVEHYMVEKYGEEKVAQIATFGTMKAKSAIKDVGRALSIPLAKVNEITKLIPDELNMTLKKALTLEPELAQKCAQESEINQMFEIARILEGSIRNVGIHAAGLVISRDPLTCHLPLYDSKESSLMVTQYAMKEVEAIGLLKIDFLGLKTLTSLQKAVQFIQEVHRISLNLNELPLNDIKTLSLLSEGKTLTIFQFESAGFREMARKLHLDKFEEIIAAVSLYRPGPMEMIPSFIDRKWAREPIDYLHPQLEEILSETYGIMVYQEQVIQIAQKLANFSLGQGDILRRAMGKKVASLMSEMEKKFIEGCLSNGIEERVARAIFEQMDKFAAYGFNKSHAAAYSYITYMTAYLKAHYPIEWMAAFMTHERSDVEELAKYMRECREMDIPLLPPDINTSGKTFTPTKEGIRFALTAIRGVGEGIIEKIVQERQTRGAFCNLCDFLRRLQKQKVGKKMVECLILSGAFSFTGWSKPQLLESIEPMMQTVEAEERDRAVGALSLFSLLKEKENATNFSPPTVIQHPLSERELLFREKELIGFFLSGHPLDPYRKSSLLQQLSTTPLAQIEKLNEGQIFTTACVVENVKVKFSLRIQKKFAVLTIGDGEEYAEVPIWASLYEEHRQLMQENQLLYLLLQIQGEGRIGRRLSCHWIGDLACIDEEQLALCSEAAEKICKRTIRKREGDEKMRETNKKEQRKCILSLPLSALSMHKILRCKEIFGQHAGAVTLQLQFTLSNGESFAQLLLDYGIQPTTDFFAALQKENITYKWQEESS